MCPLRWLTNPCRAFYLQRLQAHNWTRGDYSDVMVNMSRIWSCLRGDTAAEATLNEKQVHRHIDIYRHISQRHGKDTSSEGSTVPCFLVVPLVRPLTPSSPSSLPCQQDFVRTTTKYWVKDEHISQLKWYVLQHLPVLLQDSEAEGSSDRRDSQLINSVYLDNATLELYKGRLDKTPGTTHTHTTRWIVVLLRVGVGDIERFLLSFNWCPCVHVLLGAIAIRFRWYGTGTPETVFVERKTHREAWAMEVSVKVSTHTTHIYSNRPIKGYKRQPHHTRPAYGHKR